MNGIHRGAASLATAGDAPVDVVARTLGFEQVGQLFGLVVIEPLADQRLQPIAQRLADVAFGYALDLDVLDRVSRVDVLDETAIVADAGDNKDDAGLAVWTRDGSDRRDDLGMLGLDARRQLAESRTIQRLAGQDLDLALKTGAQAVARQTRDVNGLDDRAFRGLGVLGVRRPRRAQREDEEEQ